jgi:hypothetical protein
MGRFLLLLFAAAAAVRAEPLRFASGVRQTAFIELYTSEGCSSCPPAERWLAELCDEPSLWRDFVPVAFHVNYWDNLGWPDRFASRQFTERQYALAAAWGNGSVYTPCFVCDGAEWQAPSGRRAPAASGKTAGVLVTVFDPVGGACRVEFSPAQKTSVDYDAHLVLLGDGLSSRVTAGENAGATLRHEFVALVLVDVPLETAGATAVGAVKLPPEKTAGAERRALAVWVTRRGELASLQATGGWLP